MCAWLGFFTRAQWCLWPVLGTHGEPRSWCSWQRGHFLCAGCLDMSSSCVCIWISTGMAKLGRCSILPAQCYSTCTHVSIQCCMCCWLSATGECREHGSFNAIATECTPKSLVWLKASELFQEVLLGHITSWHTMTKTIVTTNSWSLKIWNDILGKWTDNCTLSVTKFDIKLLHLKIPVECYWVIQYLLTSLLILSLSVLLHVTGHTEPELTSTFTGWTHT